VDKEETSDTTVRQTGVSGDEANERRTYGAAMEVPEMVFFAVGEPMKAEVTSTPRNQTGKVSGRVAAWFGETYHREARQSWRSQPRPYER
jgi:hypothetical protein